MSRTIIAILLLLNGLQLIAQPYQFVDSIVKQYPKSISNPESLANRINNDFTTELDKARATYTWIATNIAYDVKKLSSKKKPHQFKYKNPDERAAKEKAYRNKIAKVTIRKGKGVCGDYSTLYKRVCELTGLDCIIISGKAKLKNSDIGKLPRGGNHAWNAVKIDNQWNLVDVTWGAGYVDSKQKQFFPKFKGIYFCTPPELFFLQHFPKNSEWLMVERKDSTFAQLPLFHSHFLETRISSIEPHLGILKTKKDQTIEIKIRTSIHPSHFSYKFKKDKYATQINYVNENGLITFKIPPSLSKTDYLILFEKSIGFVTYKVELQ